jgi:ABC-2 type transport system ATP-binding protein
MKQRLGLALSLMHDPDLLIRDEPMSGLGPLGRNLIKQLMLELQAAGKTIFFSTHILSDVQDMCNSFIVLHQGKSIFQDQTKNLTKPLDQLFVELIEQHSSQIRIQ